VHRKKQSANAVMLLLLTGARRGEVLSAQWSQFDLEGGTWTKPASATKQKRMHRIRLSAPALALLRKMAESAESEHLFPGRGENDAQGDLKRFWGTVRKEASLPDVRVHDLRHSYASILASEGLSLPVIGALLGHATAQTTQRYSHLLDGPLKRATERVGKKVMAAIEKGGGGDLIPFPTKRRRRA
jgi:integrase